jgi:hypothetical protein
LPSLIEQAQKVARQGIFFGEHSIDHGDEQSLASIGIRQKIWNNDALNKFALNSALKRSRKRAIVV